MTSDEPPLARELIALIEEYGISAILQTLLKRSDFCAAVGRLPSYNHECLRKGITPISVRHQLRKRKAAKPYESNPETRRIIAEMEPGN
jgi:hypothetical protein